MSVPNNLKRKDPPPEVDPAPISRQRKISNNEPLQPSASEDGPILTNCIDLNYFAMGDASDRAWIPSGVPPVIHSAIDTAPIHTLESSATPAFGSFPFPTFGSSTISTFEPSTAKTSHSRVAISSTVSIEHGATKRPAQPIFPCNLLKPVLRMLLPKPGHRFTSIFQLVFALHLLPKTVSSSPSAPGLLGTTGDESLELVLDNAEMAWRTAVERDPVEQAHIRWLVSQTASEFVGRLFKTSDTIAEIVLLGSFLEQRDYRCVLSSLIVQLERQPLLDSMLLEGLMQLLELASPNYLTDDDLFRILGLLQKLLKDVYKPMGDTKQSASRPIYQLAIAITRVLNVMTENNSKGLHRSEGLCPLLNLIYELKDSPDPYLKLQAAYAWQAIQYADDDESPLHSVLRRGGGVIMCAPGVTSAFRFDPDTLINGLRELAQATGQADDVVNSGAEGALEPRAGGEGAVNNILKGFRSGGKRAWYPALQGARVFVRKGRLADLRRVIFEAPCLGEPEFQQGVCQLLGEVAMGQIWDTSTRHQAIDFLAELYSRNDGTWDTRPSTKNIILGVIYQIRMNTTLSLRCHVDDVIDDLTRDRDDSYSRPDPYPFPPFLSPHFIPFLLTEVLSRQSIKYELHRLRNKRLAEPKQALYTRPRAKANPQASDDDSFSLMTEVQEFLASEREVFLIIGDSGSGKSTFNRRLEHTLWSTYKDGNRIPLLIQLSAIQDPEKGLIPEYLKMHDFFESSIQELKQSRQFVIICDGYDEARLAVNLHSTNCFNQPGQWDVKMIISSRSTYIRKDYHSRFAPQPVSPYHPTLHHLFQEATIIPFRRNQIKNYVEQFVRDPDVHALFGRNRVWSAERYMDTLETIPNLMQLVGNPFLLVLSLRTLPDVVMQGLDLSTIEMTRLQLFRTFVDQWIEINKRRLQSMHLGTEAAWSMEMLVEGGFNEIANVFLLDLAAAIYRNQQGSPVVKYTHWTDEQTWKYSFFGPDWDITLLREASPLTRTDNLHRFIHRSLLEYFYSCHLSRTSKPRFESRNPPSACRTPIMLGRLVTRRHCIAYGPLNSSNRPDPRTLLAQQPKVPTITPNWQPTETVALSQQASVDNIDLDEEPDVLQFLVEHAREDPEYSSRLWLVVFNNAAQDGVVSQDVQNARKILELAGVGF